MNIISGFLPSLLSTKDLSLRGRQFCIVQVEGIESWQECHGEGIEKGEELIRSVISLQLWVTRCLVEMPSGEGRKGAGTPCVTQGPFFQHSSYSRYWTKKVKIRRQTPSYFMSPGSPELEKGRVPHCTGTSFFKSSPGRFWLISLGP